MSTKAPNKFNSKPKNYETALAELEDWLKQMESGTLSLEDSLSAYRRGTFLVKYCQDKLLEIEAEVKVLEGGVLKPFHIEQKNDYRDDINA